MSGVYIPNMELPEDCESCLFMRTDLSGEITYCPITRRPVRWWMHDLRQSSEGHCPLVPVPEHGRLIDADVLFDFILNIYKNAQGEARKAYSDVLDVIVATGDVIPADKGGRGMNCKDCKYSHDTGTALLCWGQRFAPPVDADDWCEGWKPRNVTPQTNYDRIVSMTPEELAVWMNGIIKERYIEVTCDGWLSWLKSPAEEQT